jgi:hypothetical protein
LEQLALISQLIPAIIQRNTAEQELEAEFRASKDQANA